MSTIGCCLEHANRRVFCQFIALEYNPSIIQISSTALKALGVAAIIMAGGLVYWLTPTSGLPPEKVIQGTFDNLQNAQSFRTSSEAQLLLNYDAIVAKNPQAGGIAALLPFSSSSPLTFSIEGAYDLTETENPAFDQTMTFRMIQEDQKIEGAIQMIAKDNLQYVQLAKAPLWGFINLQPFARKWIKIDPQALQKQAEQFGADSFSASTPSFAEQMEKFKKAFGDEKLVKVSKVLREEDVEGVLSYHYEIQPNAENLLRALEEYVRETAEEEIEELWKPEDRKRLVAILGSVKAELWVDKTKLLPSKAMVMIPFQDGKDNYGKMTITTLWKDFNVPVTIEAPASSVSIEEFVQSIFGPMPTSTTPRVKPGRI